LKGVDEKAYIYILLGKFIKRTGSPKS